MKKEITAQTAKRLEPLVGQGRDPNRIPALLDTLRQVWLQEGTDLRLGQLLVSLNLEHGADSDLFNLEDEQLMKWLQERLGPDV